jgi:hypothetical protein
MVTFPGGATLIGRRRTTDSPGLISDALRPRTGVNADLLAFLGGQARFDKAKPFDTDEETYHERAACQHRRRPRGLDRWRRFNRAY